jgi:arylsulfatase A-like enzyme
MTSISGKDPDMSVATRRLSRRDTLRGIGGAGLTLSIAGEDAGATPAATPDVPATAGEGDARPNILVIIVDEMRDWQWFPDQDILDEHFPNMARLQRGAVRFGRHYTASNMCSPSRGSLLTGLYSHQTGFVLTQGSNTDTLQGRPDSESEGDSATPESAAPPWPPLDPRFPTWGTLLRQQGYETWWWGKWHVNDDSCDLEQYGFSGGTCPSPNGAPGEGTAEDPNIADQAIEWLNAQGHRGPWCTTVSFVNPHDIQWYPRQTRMVPGQRNPESIFEEMVPNYETPDQMIDQKKPRLQLVSEMALPQVFGEIPHWGPNFERGWLKMMDLYYQLHRDVDAEIGRVLDALEANPEVAENTIIVFTSDHGEYCGSHGMRGKGAGLYEEGIRVPFWVKDPTGRFAAQPDIPRTQITSSVDLVPMLLSFASGGNGWRDEAPYAHLASRFDMTSVLQDAAAPGRPYALHATDEDGFEFGPRLFPFLQDAPFHVMGLITDDAKIGVYADWADDSDEILAEGQEFEFYDYTSEEGRLELVNSATVQNEKFQDLYDLLMTDAVPNELRAPLPDELEIARQDTMAASVARIAYDRAQATGD